MNDVSQEQTKPKSPFVAGTGLMGTTLPGQRVTKANAHFLPPGSVVRLSPSNGVLIHLHDDLWYWRDGCAWCYDCLSNHLYRLPGILCHLPSKVTDKREWESIGNNDLRLYVDPTCGFYHVTLRDADDGDVIVVNEDDLESLRDRLTQILTTKR